MPQVNITVIGAAPDTQQKTMLFEKMSDLMVEILGRNRKSVVVSVTSAPASDWAVNGSAPCAAGVVGVQAVVKVLAGTNSDEQKARMIAAATGVLRAVLGSPTMPLYVTFEEIPAAAWGYDGRTVADLLAAPRAASR